MVSEIEVILRLLLAVLLSGMVGLEREAKGRAAGFRTHILVCVGSALIMMTSLSLYFQLGGKGSGIDASRIPAQVVSGIGFLGAGTIIQIRDSVRGLTTAASVWVAAAIGLAVGCGFYIGAVATTALVLVVLLVLHGLEGRVGTKTRSGGASSA